MKKMKKFDVSLEMVTMTKEGQLMMKNTMPVTVLANDKGGAILAGLDVGQAVSRSANCSSGAVAIYFRVIAATEKATH